MVSTRQMTTITSSTTASASAAASAGAVLPAATAATATPWSLSTSSSSSADGDPSTLNGPPAVTNNTAAAAAAAAVNHANHAMPSGALAAAAAAATMSHAIVMPVCVGAAGGSTMTTMPTTSASITGNDCVNGGPSSASAAPTAPVISSSQSAAVNAARSSNNTATTSSMAMQRASTASSSHSNNAAAQMLMRARPAMASAVASAARMQTPKHLLDLPMEMLEEIFAYAGYKSVSKMRLVSKSMNAVCSAILNSTFSRLSIYLNNRFRKIKNLMPRRESSRRNHPLSLECDIVETCYMRISLLQMTFGKHIDRKHICFFAGAILDEVFSVLRAIRSHPQRPHDMTEELYDLTTMAMEYFKEHLEPCLPSLMPIPVMSRSRFVDYSKNNTKTKYVLDTTTSNAASSSALCGSSGPDSDADSAALATPPPPPQSNMVLRKGIRKIKQGMKRYNNQLSVLRNDLRYCKRKATEQHKVIGEMQKLLAEQQKQSVEMAARLNENDKKNEEMSMKISALLQESNKCKTELQYWRDMGRAPTNEDDVDDDDDAIEDAANADAAPAAAAASNEESPANAAAADNDKHAANIDAAVAAGPAQLEQQQPKPQVQTGGEQRGDSSSSTNTTSNDISDAAEANVSSVLRSPSSRFASNNTVVVAVGSAKRKADAAALADPAAEPMLKISSAMASSNYGVEYAGNAAVVGVAEAPSSSSSHIGSDIVKKARRVQSKARGQHPHSVSGSSSSCSSCSSSSCSSNIIHCASSSCINNLSCSSHNLCGVSGGNHNNQCAANPTSSNAAANNGSSIASKSAGRNK